MLVNALLGVLYGALEGVTEWLPISSTGHLILLRAILPHAARDLFFSFFEVAIQLGAMLAVVVLFWHKLSPFTRDRERRRAVLLLWCKIAVAVLPAAALGVLVDDFLEQYLSSPAAVAAMLVLYGILFLIPFDRFCRVRVASVEDISFKTALGIGFFQVLSLIPGTSRSGATILGGLLLGASRVAAAEFSFFLGLPTIAGAGLLRGVKFFAAGGMLEKGEILMLALGTAMAFLVSLVTIRFLMDFVRRHTFKPFGVYRIVLGAVVLLTLL